MAFDGVVISNVVSDLKKKLVDGRIYKIYQPENDELNIIIKTTGELPLTVICRCKSASDLSAAGA